MSAHVKRADWVRAVNGPATVEGIVLRVARDGSWADVRWGDGTGREWSKRMPTSALVVLTTIRRVIGGAEWEITDLTREWELDGVQHEA